MTERPVDSRAGGRKGRQAFEEALRADAARIRAQVPAGTERRLEAALARERPPGYVLEPTKARRETFLRPWLAGSLVGVGVAALLVLLIGRLGNDLPAPAPSPETSVADVSPGEMPSELLQSFRAQVPLKAETAELTAPLEQELENLKSDLEKARGEVERDLALTF